MQPYVARNSKPTEAGVTHSGTEEAPNQRGDCCFYALLRDISDWFRKSNPVEDELDAIRIRHYEQTKNMTIEESVAYVNGKAEQILKPYGIQPIYMDMVRTIK